MNYKYFFQIWHYYTPKHFACQGVFKNLYHTPIYIIYFSLILAEFCGFLAFFLEKVAKNLDFYLKIRQENRMRTGENIGDCRATLAMTVGYGIATLRSQ